ncbi:hypothetical protein LNP27_02880 [Flavobacterium galactosidilyticum]|uniref:hypothetical protein n=1 Tax=Flavobacterium galactosidilyticum TaxID=2893886 RepID=UPI001E442B72|nr:hypothetical protein [Flavobacterium sp. F-340]UFH46990.1 hypothetical protein LNP27_02880 [Flavobacterium sp. F-340]
MEIDNLKKAWQETADRREKNTEINYLLLKKMNQQITSSSISKILNFQKVGAFLALIYAVISFVLGFIIFKSYHHSIPLFISGVLMVYSFLGHYKKNKMIEDIDFYKTSVKDYLKTVLLYENWILKSKKHDGIITCFWIIVITPIYIKYVFHIDVYQDSYSVLVFMGVLIGGFLFGSFLVKSMYKDYDRKFNDIKIQLDEIIEFEKE